MIKTQTKKINLFNIFYISILLIGIILVVALPKLSINTFYQGLNIWATKVLPALLPFLILTKLLSYTSFLKILGKYLSPLTQRLYGVGGVAGYIYVMSIVSGYPIGAKLTSDLYSSRTITRGQAVAITSFCSTSGPLFILGTVAIGMYNSSKIGAIILICHIIGAMLNGLIYRNREKSEIFALQFSSPPNALSESMTSSLLSIMTIGGFIAIFYMFLQIILQLNIISPLCILFENLGISSGVTQGVFSGLIEVTSGCLLLSQTSLSPKLLTIISTFLISFGGLSIHAQAYCYLKNFDMSYSKFLLQKVTQAIISTILAFLCTLFIEI